MQREYSLALACAAIAIPLCSAPPASAQASLGTAQSFAVLGGSTVTSTGPTTITGNLGLSPGSAVTGIPPGIVTGAIHIGDAVALQAQNDATTTYNTLAAMACNFDLTGQDLGGLTLIPGVYCFSSSAQLTGALTLDALGSDSSVFVFKIGTTLTTASGASVSVINGGSGCNVFWQIGSSATLGSATSFAGNLLASASITMATGANVSGRALALSGAVILDSNSITIPPECQCVVDSGAGCAGTGGLVPELSLDCPIPGSSVTIEIENGLGGATAIVFIGPPAAHPICGCTLLVRPGPVVLVLQLAGSVAGNGTLALSIAVPASGPAGSYAVQAFVLDAGALCQFSSTNGVIVTIE